jgi:GNAT superfamily N-acetyltransferase
MPEIRPMAAHDAPGAMDVVAAAFEVLLGHMGEPAEPWSEERRARSIRRTERFVRTDPDGCWVAVDGDDVAGMTIAIRRERLWGLAMLFVHPEHQSGRVGTRLLEHARRTAGGADLELIMSSPDPRALRRYASLGLALHPAFGAKGEVDRTALPAGLRSARAPTPTSTSSPTSTGGCAASRAPATSRGSSPTTRPPGCSSPTPRARAGSRCTRRAT